MMRKPSQFARATMRLGAVALLATFVALSTSPAAPAAQPAAPIAFDPPYVFCASSDCNALTVRICGANAWGGAPFGVMIEWTTLADFEANGFTNACSATIPTALTEYQPAVDPNPDPGDCAFVQLGNNGFGGLTTCPGPLDPNTDYVIRAKANGGVVMGMDMPASDFSPHIICRTAPCEDTSTDDNCTFTIGYWKNHIEDWPVAMLTLGSTNYNQSQLLSILTTPVKGNGLVSLAHQLIAAKLNIANGADDTDVADAIADADALIGGLVVPPVGSGSLPTSQTSALVGTLTSFNEGDIGPGHCGD